MSFWRKVLWFPMSEKESGRKSTRIATLLFFVLIVLLILFIYADMNRGIVETKEQANCSSAIATLRTLASLQEIFLEEDWDGDGKKDYAKDIDELLSSDESTKYQIDSKWLTSHSKHYRFTVSSGDGEHWLGKGTPVVRNTAEYPTLFINERGEIRTEYDKPATKGSESEVQQTRPAGH